MLRSNIIFRDICCFSSATLLPSSLKCVVNSLVFFVNICCFGECMGPVWAFLMCMSSSLGIHIILHLTAEFCPNRTIRDIVLTSYPLFKMAATASQFYFRFWFSWLSLFGKVEIYLHTKFQRDNLNPLLRYYYFRFLKNKRPPRWNSTSGSNY